MDLISFLHSLLRYGVLLVLTVAFLINLRGWLMSRPILTGERMITIIAMVLCHVQFAVGLILYAMSYQAIDQMEGPEKRFYKYDHALIMIVAIIFVTLGRSLSKRAQNERAKQMRVAIFYGVGLLLIFWATPWPFKEVGRDLGWL